MKNDVHRALTVLGLICEFRDVLVDSSTWENEMEAGDVPHLVDVNQLNWNTVLPACFRLFSRYLKKVDIATKCKALAALKGIFIAHPQLLLLMNHVGLFDEVTSDEAGEPLQLEALDCWRSILEAEEDRIDSGKADAKMDADGNVTVSKRISGDQNGDATLFGGVLTSHANRLFGMTQSRSPTIRFSTLRLLGLLLRQGLVNPNEAVPYLFALQGDVDNNPIRNMARTLLMAEGEKRPDILRQRISIGMKLAYKFQKAVYPKKSSISALVVARDDDEVHVQTIFDRVFEECIGKNQKQRRGLYDSLLRFFEINDEAVTTRAPRNDLSLLSFVAQILAHLPYSVSTDPLFLVHHIINVYTVQGLQIHEKFADLLLPHGLFGTDELEISNDIEDTLEKAAKCKFPSRSSGASSFCSNAFPIAEFVDVVREGAVLVLLLRLKNFLCASYNLSLARCAGFDPNSKERLCDKGMAKVKFSAPFGSYVASSVLNSDNADTDKDALIRQYAEIRRCLRDEKGLDIFPVHLSDDDGKEDSVLAVD